VLEIVSGTSSSRSILADDKILLEKVSLFLHHLHFLNVFSSIKEAEICNPTSQQQFMAKVAEVVNCLAVKIITSTYHPPPSKSNPEHSHRPGSCTKPKSSRN